MKYPIAIAALAACWLTASTALAGVGEDTLNNDPVFQEQEARARARAEIESEQPHRSQQYDPEAAVAAGVKPSPPIPPRQSGWANANEAERANERYNQELDRYNNALERWTQLREAEAQAKAEQAEARADAEASAQAKAEAQAALEQRRAQNEAPKMVSITHPVSIPLPYGTTVLPIGTKLEFVSRDGSEVHIRYMSAEYVITVSATDLK